MNARPMPPPMGRNGRPTGPKPPESLRDLPRYVRELFGGFFSRLGYIIRLVWETNPAILFILLFIALFDGFMPVVGAIITRDILNQLQMDFGQAASVGIFLASPVFGLLIVLFVYRILSAIVGRINGAVTRIAGERVVRHVRLKIMNKARSIDVASYDSPEFYEKLENANREAGMRPIQTLSSALSIVSTTVGLVSYLVILFSAPDMWWAALLIALMAVPSAIVTFYYRNQNVRYMRWRSKERRQMEYYSSLMVNKDMVKEVRLYDLSDTLIDRYDDAFSRYYKGLRRLIVHEGVWHVSIALVSAIINCLFFAMVAWKVYNGEILIGDYSLLTGALTSVASNVAAIITSASTIYEGTLFIENLISFLAHKATLVSHCDPPVPVAHGQMHTIVLENISFRYPGTQRDVLKNINLTIEPGESLVLVGLNGAGKTTLIKLLTRLYDPTEGRILLDGADIRSYDVKDLYRMYGIIFQDFGRYAETAGENIRFGSIHKKADREAIRQAAGASGASEFIDKLPDGYDTPLMRIFEQNGIELSGGQWQKLAIARAFYNESDVLILDEPTASLDAIAEQEVYDQFDRLRKGKTTIFVSHRLSSATMASKIVVLEGGQIVEMGNHASLMEAKGRYCELFTTQAKRYMEQSGGKASQEI